MFSLASSQLLMFKKVIVPKEPPHIHAKLNKSDFSLYFLNKWFSDLHSRDFSSCFDPRKNTLNSVRVRMKHPVHSLVLLREVSLSTSEWLTYTPLSLRWPIYTLFIYNCQVYTSPNPHTLSTCCEVLALPAVLPLDEHVLRSFVLRFTCGWWGRDRRRRCSGTILDGMYVTNVVYD